MSGCRIAVASADYGEATRLARLIRSQEITDCTAVVLNDATLAEFSDSAPDLIIFDQCHDEEKRLSQIRRIRQQETTAGAIVIALYRAHDFSSLGALAGVGVSSCVRKSPFERELAQAMRGVIQFWIGPSSLPYRNEKRVELRLCSKAIGAQEETPVMLAVH